MQNICVCFMHFVFSMFVMFVSYFICIFSELYSVKKLRWVKFCFMCCLFMQKLWKFLWINWKFWERKWNKRKCTWGLNCEGIDIVWACICNLNVLYWNLAFKFWSRERKVLVWGRTSREILIYRYNNNI